MSNNLDPQVLSKLYDRLYQKAGRLLKKHNPCGFSEGKCRFEDNCCEDCEHLSPEGCTVKALACKLWLCDCAKSYFPECNKELNKLWKVALKYDLIGERETKEETFREMAEHGMSLKRFSIRVFYKSLL